MKLQPKYILENQSRNTEMKTKKACSIKLLEALRSFETSRPADFRRRKIFFADRRHTVVCKKTWPKIDFRI